MHEKQIDHYQKTLKTEQKTEDAEFDSTSSGPQAEQYRLGAGIKQLSLFSPSGQCCSNFSPLRSNSTGEYRR